MAELTFSSDEYSVEQSADGKIRLVPKRKYVSKKELLSATSYSSIQECLIQQGDKVISTDTQYQTILKAVWKTMDIKTLRDTTDWLIMLGNQHRYKGYDFWEEMGVSFCGRDGENTLKEILKMCEKLKMTIQLTIQTQDGTILHYKG